MRIWVTGGTGMLGKRVAAACQKRGHAVLASTHQALAIDNPAQVWGFAEYWKPDAIINCAGVRPGGDILTMIEANAIGPHVLAGLGIRMVHMSTDCVFSGKNPLDRCKLDRPDAEDVYGRSKMLGEVAASNVLNVRGSFIGPEHGLLRWLLDNDGNRIGGFTNCIWNGSTATIVGNSLVVLAEGNLTGVYHLASPDAMSKYDLLTKLVRDLGLKTIVVENHEPEKNMALQADLHLPTLRSIGLHVREEIEKWSNPK